MDAAAIEKACAVCGGCGCTVAFDPETQEPKITDELCPGCNGTGERHGIHLLRTQGNSTNS